MSSVLLHLIERGLVFNKTKENTPTHYATAFTSGPGGVLPQAAPERELALWIEEFEVLRVTDIPGKWHQGRSTEGYELGLQRPRG